MLTNRRAVANALAGSDAIRVATIVGSSSENEPMPVRRISTPDPSRPKAVNHFSIELATSAHHATPAANIVEPRRDHRPRADRFDQRPRPTRNDKSATMIGPGIDRPALKAAPTMAERGVLAHTTGEQQFAPNAPRTATRRSTIR